MANEMNREDYHEQYMFKNEKQLKHELDKILAKSEEELSKADRIKYNGILDVLNYKYDKVLAEHAKAVMNFIERYDSNLSEWETFKQFRTLLKAFNQRLAELVNDHKAGADTIIPLTILAICNHTNAKADYSLPSQIIEQKLLNFRTANANFDNERDTLIYKINQISNCTFFVQELQQEQEQKKTRPRLFSQQREQPQTKEPSKASGTRPKKT